MSASSSLHDRGYAAGCVCNIRHELYSPELIAVERERLIQLRLAKRDPVE
jgi:hypothetical protein